MSVEFQLFLIAPSLIYVLHRNHAVGKRLLVALAALFALLTGAVVAAFKLTPLITVNHLLDAERLEEYVQVTLLATFSRTTAYLVGIVCGYYCVNSGKHKRHTTLRKHAIALLLIAALVAVTLVTVSHSEDIQHNQILVFLITSVIKPLWCLCVAWIAYAVSSVGGKFLTCLSSRPLTRLSRLTYSFTLVHLIPILIRSASVSEVHAWSNASLLVEAAINLVFACICAFVFHVMFESPFLAIQKGVKQRIEHNEVTKLRSLRPSDKPVNDVEC